MSSVIINFRQYRYGTKNNPCFFGSRSSLDEPERGSIQPDFMPEARDIDALLLMF